MAFALVTARDAYRKHRRAPERRGRVRSLGRGEPAVTEPRARADDAGPDRAHRHVEPTARRPRERRGGRDALELAAEARAGRDGGGDQTPVAQRPDRVRETERKRTAGVLNVRDL